VRLGKWYNLGLQLEIEDYDLQTIERNHPQDQEGCKRDMFRTWLNICPQASYRQLVQALVEVGDVAEAHRLCKKYGESCTNKYHNLLIIHSQAIDFNRCSKKGVGLFLGLHYKYTHPLHVQNVKSVRVPYMPQWCSLLLLLLKISLPTVALSLCEYVAAKHQTKHKRSA